jgi:hypothetical protein
MAGKNAGKNARGPTAQEFADLVAELEGILDAYNTQREQDGLPRVEWVWSWDNTNIHGNVQAGDWLDMGIDMGSWSGLTDYSPDIHAVIENVHARVMQVITPFLHEYAPEKDKGMPYVLGFLKRQFYAVISKEWAQAATHRLFLDVLPAILKFKGWYAPKSLR